MDHHRSHRFLKTCTALAICGTASSALAQPPYLGQPNLSKRPCLNDTYVVEAPLWAAAFPSAFRANLQTRIGAALSTTWFCAPTETCFASDFQVRVNTLLPNYASTALYPSIPEHRRDGHLRFYVVDFQRRINSVWSRVSVLEEKTCAVVARIRQDAATELGIAIPSCTGASCAQPRVVVARECLVSGLDVEGWIDPTTSEWSFARINASTSSSLPPVDVALVDSGVPSAYRASLGVVSERPLPGIYPGPIAQHHPHGTHMAALIHRVAPNAQIYSYRGLDQNGVASVSAVAAALDGALFPSPTSSAPRRSLVVNLSVGFPRELTQPMTLTGASCTTWEDGLGESLRYALDVAADLDALGPPVVVSAAGGNAILERTTPASSLVRGAALTPCPNDAAASSAAPFFPAGFGSVESCRRFTGTILGFPIFWYGKRGLPVLPIGATDYRDLRSAVTLADAEPFLHAPGEHVFAANSALPAAPQTITCTTADVGLSRGFESPASVSGTSASAALVTGAIARVLGLAPQRSQGVPWRAAHLGRLAYLSGADLCIAAPSRTRLDSDRFEWAATNAACANLRTCVASASHPIAPMIGEATKNLCSVDRTACFAAHPGTASPSCAATLPMEPDWPAGHLSSLSGAPDCTLSLGAHAGPTTPFCTAGPCTFEDSQLSALRPQPETIGCPTCLLKFDLVGSAAIFGELNDAFPAGTVLQNPYLVLLDAGKNPLPHIDFEPGRTWKPGEVFSVDKNIGWDEAQVRDFFESGGTAALDMEVVMPDRRARALSSLAVVY